MSNNMDRPIVEIPVSVDIDEIEKVRVKLLFDDPMDKDKGSYILYIYTVEHDGEESVMFAYSGLYNAIQKTGAVAGSVLDIARFGEGKDTKWYVKLIDGPAAKAKSHKQVTRTRRGRNSRETSTTIAGVYKPLTGRDIEMMNYLIRERIAMMGDALAIIEEFEFVEELTDDQRLRLAHGAVIAAERKFRPGMIAPGDDGVPHGEDGEDSVEEFITIVSQSDQVLDGILNGIVELTGAKDRKDAIEALKSVGVRSTHDIDENDTDTWVKVFNVANEYFTLVAGDVPEDDAVKYCREAYGIANKTAIPF